MFCEVCLINFFFAWCIWLLHLLQNCFTMCFMLSFSRSFSFNPSVCSYLVHDKDATPEKLDDLAKFLQLVWASFFLAPFSQILCEASTKTTFRLFNCLLFPSMFLPFRSDMSVALMILRVVFACWIKRFQRMNLRKTMQGIHLGGFSILHFLLQYIHLFARWSKLVA